MARLGRTVLALCSRFTWIPDVAPSNGRCSCCELSFKLCLTGVDEWGMNQLSPGLGLMPVWRISRRR